MTNDLTGRRFGRLTALAPTKERKNGYTIWRCKCDCGNELLAESRHLKRGTLTDCGCVSNKPPADLTGLRFGKLLVLHRINRDTPSIAIWHCLCDCGNEIDVSRKRLLENECPNCGCLAQTRLLGQRFGHWTVYAYAHKKDGHHYWHCRRDNGKESVIRQNLLISRGKKADAKAAKPRTPPKATVRNTSGVPGVSWNTHANKWEVNITIHQKRHYLGIYTSKEEAIAVRLDAEARFYSAPNLAVKDGDNCGK